MQGLNLFAKYNSDAVRILIEIAQKQPTEVFCKKVFLEISQIHRKTPVPESLF